MPDDLDVTALTHVNFAFAYFDPTTFEVTPMSNSDIPLYTKFTGLKARKPSLQTWIAIGGWAFNDPGNSPDTRTAFSDMSRTSDNRKAFIHSLVQFMETYNFDGVDIDWEYPSADDRGGDASDMQNFVYLLQDMRSYFGDKYGISATLPSSYWYLRGFDLQGMSRYVDWLNVMTYVSFSGTNSETTS
jgi:GH18 family chitinase